MNSSNKKLSTLFLGAYLIIIGFIFLFMIGWIYSMVLFPDEFGYWSYSAMILGWDWSKITGLGNYYAPGYTLFLLPALILGGSSSVASYRIAVFFNFVLLGVSAVLIYRILYRLFIGKNSDQKPEGMVTDEGINNAKLALIAVVGASYPAFMFFAEMTLAEVVILFCFILSVRLFQRYADENGINKILFGCGFVLVLLYSYTVHKRNVALVIAGIVCLVWDYVLYLKRGKSGIAENSVADASKGATNSGNAKVIKGSKGKKVTEKNTGKAQASSKNIGSKTVVAGLSRNQIIGIVVIGIVVIFSIVIAVSGIMQKALVVGASNINTFSGQLERIMGLLNPDGIKDLFVGFFGKIFYLTAVSYGLVWWGLFGALKRAVADLRQKYADGTGLTFLYIVFSAVLGIIISAVFNNIYFRVDSVIYGRYTENYLALLMPLGIVFVLDKAMDINRFLLGQAGCILVLLITCYTSASHVVKAGLQEMSGFFIMGFSYWIHNEYGTSDWDMGAYIWQCFVFGLIVTVIVSVIIILCKKVKLKEWLLVIVIVMQIGLSIHGCVHYVVQFNAFDHMDAEITEMIYAIKETDPEDTREVVYYNSGAIQFIDLIQFSLRDIPVHIQGKDETFNKGDIVILDNTDNRIYDEVFSENFTQHIETAHFVMFYN
ncbi:MAG: hypothetical protein K6A23_03650 [Butyrivibrio sp.]|nr:hypothetical protein [Butyrivibrio sp.]